MISMWIDGFVRVRMISSNVGKIVLFAFAARTHQNEMETTFFRGFVEQKFFTLLNLHTLFTSNFWFIISSLFLAFSLFFSLRSVFICVLV